MLVPDPKGSWFRVYSRQVRQHPKFRALTHAELGGWLDIRSEIDLLGGEPLPDRRTALLVLRRRPGAAATRLLDRLIAARLLDATAEGGIAVHDLADHDRSYPSDAPDRTRERKRLSRAQSRGVTNGVTNPRAREESREEEKREETDSARTLPSSDDPLTIICELTMSTAPIDDLDFRQKVDAQTRRFTASWVIAAYRQAYQDLLAEGKRPQRWSLSRLAEVQLAGWTRAEELRQVEAQEAHDRSETERLRAAEQAQTPEERERQDLFRRAVGIWIRGGRRGKVPEQVDELRDWIAANDQQAGAA